MGPPSSLLEGLSKICSTSRFESAPISAGSEPASLLLLSLSSVTRPASFVVMPCHSPSGLALNQFVLLTQFAPSVAS